MATAKKSTKSASKKSTLKDLKPSKDAKGGARHAETSKARPSAANKLRPKNLN